MTATHCPEIDALIEAFYAAFDNRGGDRPPALTQLRAMFAPGAVITRVTPAGADTWTPDAFIAPRAAILTDGALTDFHEWEIEAQTTVFTNIASRRSLYRKQGVMNGAPYQGGGRKFIQLARIEGHWLIAAILWEDD